MASRSVSPGGALLRASRLFSVPPPLPRPAGDLSSTATFNSDSATLPHPTHLSIATPHSSLVRGDWGFKRPLPLRSTTKSSTPFIRVEAIDTIEHVTEFGSSADHAITLQKWQEMGVPLTTPMPKRDRIMDFDKTVNGKSVFESQIDSTTQAEGGGVRKDDARWKFTGPWLAGQTEGDFNAYVQKEVRKRKGEFFTFLRASHAKNLTKDAQRKYIAEHGVPEESSKGAPAALPIVEPISVTDEQLIVYIKALRQDRTELYKQIRTFLDLPPSPSRGKAMDENALYSILEGRDGNATYKAQENFLSVSMSPYAESGPPKTHPSAGLSYLRTAATLHNHPLHGPQKTKPPVQARVVMPKGAATGNFAPVLGVGGFVTDVPNPAEHTSFDLRGSRARDKYAAKAPLVPGLLNIEPDKQGGSKTWVHPQSASIDPKGRIMLKVTAADDEAVAVKEGKEEEIPRDIATLSKRTYESWRASEGIPTKGQDVGYGLGQGFQTRSNEKSRGDEPAARRNEPSMTELDGLLNQRH